MKCVGDGLGFVRGGSSVSVESGARVSYCEVSSFISGGATGIVTTGCGLDVCTFVGGTIGFFAQAESNRITKMYFFIEILFINL